MHFARLYYDLKSPLSFFAQGEMMLYFAALPVVRARGQWNYSLPNPLNIAFNFHYFLLFTILLYIPRKFSSSYPTTTCSLVPRSSWQAKEDLVFWVAFLVTWDGGYSILSKVHFTSRTRAFRYAIWLQRINKATNLLGKLRMSCKASLFHLYLVLSPDLIWRVYHFQYIHCVRYWTWSVLGLVLGRLRLT